MILFLSQTLKDIFLHPPFALRPGFFVCEYGCTHLGFPGGSDGKESAWNVGDLGWIHGLRRSPGKGNSYPLPRSVLGVHWKDWCWSWNSNTLATWCKELTHWKRPWCWEGLGAGGEGDNRGWDGWMASPTWWAWVWVDSGSLWWTGRPGVLWSMGSQRVGHAWATELHWTHSSILA